MPSDLDKSFYISLNENIVMQIHFFKVTSKELKQNNEFTAKIVNQQEKYMIYTMFYSKADMSIKLYFPSHFEALRKLYCGSYDS